MQRKGPLPGKIFALCIPERRFAALFGYMARVSCQSQLVLDARRRYVAREGRFSRPRPLRGCMKRENCHGWPPGNAPRRNLTIARRLGTHFASIPPSPNCRERIEGAYAAMALASVERTTAKSCRRRTLGGAARKAASRSGSTRKADLLAGIHKSGSQGTAARRDSRGGSTRTSGSHAGFEGRLDTQDTAARREFARRPQRVREAAQRARPTGHKKAPLRRTAPSPQNYGRKPDPP